MTQEVVIAPGLWMPAAAMALLAFHLKRAGYAPRVFAYRGRSPMEGNIERLVRFVTRPAHFIGHSLGGVLLLDALNRHPDLPVASVLLIGAPVRGCLAGRRLGRAGVGRWMLGACGPVWEERPAQWRRREPLGVIAGTRPLGLGRALGALPGRNDGVVRVEETEVDGATARTLVPYGHSMLIASGGVLSLAERFLSTGRFQ